MIRWLRFMAKLLLLHGNLLMTLQTLVKAQVIYADNILIHVADGGILHANGGIRLANQALLQNEGSVTTTKNSTLPSAGNFEISSSTQAEGNGLYRIEQDWVNDGQFIAGSSTVELYGDTEQFIRSNTGTITTFNHLILLGNGTGINRRKTLQGADAATGPNGNLVLNDRELATGPHTFTVMNTNPAAVSNFTLPGQEGFVSSQINGYFSRYTNSPSDYVFPVGSSSGVTRYRPVIVRPILPANGAYLVRLNNYSASQDGMNLFQSDPTLCQLNDLYYHSLLRQSGSPDAQIQIAYDPAADGGWATIASWTSSQNQWNDIGAGSGPALGLFSTLVRSGWAFPNLHEAYVLATTRPAGPSVQCPEFCENQNPVVFEATASQGGYQWIVPPQAQILSGQGTSILTVNWTGSPAWVQVLAPNMPQGCPSLPDSCQPIIHPLPVADFVMQTEYGSSTSVLFSDNSQGAHVWLWDFGDGNTSSENAPLHAYAEPGEYQVILYVESDAGCTDSASQKVIIESNLLFFPNAFTPDGNHLNETFQVIASDLRLFELLVFDRWGELIFSTKDPARSWDGSFRGKPCPPGTYVFRLTYAFKNQKEITKFGHIHLIR